MAKVALPLVHRALKRCIKAHRKQELDGDAPLPYATHPIDVLNLVRYVAGVTDEEMLAAALLHDLVEETDATERDIESEFGARVARIVRELTREEQDKTGLTEEEAWLLKTRVMLEEIDRMSDEAKLIKLADRTSNIRTALAVRTGKKLEQYVRQSDMILEHIDRSVCPVLWDRIKAMSDSAPVGKR